MNQNSSDNRFTDSKPLPPLSERSLGHWRGLLSAWWLLGGLVILLSTIFGVAQHFSSTIYMDEWDGMIGFWQKLGNGDTSAWWAQHNEHRIVLTRALFWLDLHFFKGQGYLLIPANVILHLAIAAVFIVAYIRFATQRHSLAVVVGVVLTGRFLWMQDDNLTWGFQSQFIAVYLFAIASFLAYSRSTREGPLTPQVLGLVLAFTSMLSMSNGLIAFPVLVVMSVMLRLTWKHSLVAIAAMGVAWALYFHGYRSPPYHASPVDGILHHPIDVIHYALNFLGSPAAFLGAGLHAPLIVGMLLLMTVTTIGVLLVRRGELNSYRLYIGATFAFAAAAALLAGSGRYNLGLDTAFTSRYTTPALIAWLSAFLLFADVASKTRFWTVVAVLGVLVLPAGLWSQRIMMTMPPQPFYRDVAVLGVKMGIRDGSYIDWMYPRNGQDIVVSLMNYADKEGLTVYGKDWVRNIGTLEFSRDRLDATACKGSLDDAKHIDGAWLLNGWALAEGDRKAKLIVLTGQDDATVGYGVLGEVRPDVAKAVAGASGTTGWRGYVISANGQVSAWLYTRGRFCPLASNIDFRP
ncbi:hypothetical protein [Xanthomonas prunicola]|uniref:Uncharacterized protein n=1 Tax=Xanthomonas prunicola TaxID=2053930 RepID=A0A9Q9IWN1_9XANT|nr:hypothetical protein [Xanthomonas prunicola]UXA47619.1 hypothetical protein M0D44_14795 [Xanthomonas prunicola]UXA56081.1 hypothetical protein M0D47_14735 [Xanthomonas prunicola]UXA62056.1 hypothetical protein M0D48_03235 [Xanthomonas prunicola]UXA64251.1 hypothetical protein M0D43_14900 [Xanthomonas prunicola]